MQYVTSISRIAETPSLTWHPNDRYFADITGEQDSRAIIVYDTKGNRVAAFQGDSGQVRSILWNRVGSAILAATRDHEIQLWDATSYVMIKAVSQLNEGAMA